MFRNVWLESEKKHSEGSCLDFSLSPHLYHCLRREGGKRGNVEHFLSLVSICLIYICYSCLILTVALWSRCYFNNLFLQMRSILAMLDVLSIFSRLLRLTYTFAMFYACSEEIKLQIIWLISW